MVLFEKNTKLEALQSSTWQNRRFFQLMQIKIILTVFLAGLITTQGYNSETAPTKAFRNLKN